MNRLEETLWKEYDEVVELNKVITDDDERKRELLERKERILNQLVKVEQMNKEIKAENSRELTRNKINVVMFGINTLISLYVVNKTFKFDTDSTLTSTLGRNILNSFIPKTFKR